MIPMKKIILTTVCTLALAACQSAAAPKEDKLPGKREPLEISGGIYDLNKPIPNDPSVQQYATEGDFQNPLNGDTTHSVLDNTTAGGYTVFDDSVKVYPLPGDETPAYMPTYAVPPLKGQYKAEQPMVGTRQMGLASAGILPPVPNMEVVEPQSTPTLTSIPDADPYSNPPVSGAVRQPMSLTSPEPLTMQPPAQARPPMPSPFMKAQPVMDEGGAAPVAAEAPRAPMPPMADDMMAAPAPAAPAPAAQGVTTAGRRSAPLLTGY
ncbi:MAG: hypothetical protein KGQ41_02775 [Alphaproteobacteria bacterium]|nr:hypothetical protein [Alphaproteobacteria bacterium]